MPGPPGRPSTVAPTAWAAGLSSGAVVAIGVLGALAMAGSPLPSAAGTAGAWRPDAVRVVVPAADRGPDAGPSGPVPLVSGAGGDVASLRALTVVDDRGELAQPRDVPTEVLGASLDPVPAQPATSAPPAPPVPATPPAPPSTEAPDRPEVRPGTTAPDRPGPPHARTQGQPPRARVPGRPASVTVRAGVAVGSPPAAQKAKPAKRAEPAEAVKPSPERTARPLAVRAGHAVRAARATADPASAPVDERLGRTAEKGSPGPDR